MSKASKRRLNLKRERDQQVQRLRYERDRRIITSYEQAARFTMPKLLKENVSAAKSLMLIAARGYALASGRTDINQYELVQASQLLLQLWKDNLWTPPEHYPYSLEKTLGALQAEIDATIPEAVIEVPESDVSALEGREEQEVTE